jgi:hypothetical protein
MLQQSNLGLSLSRKQIFDIFAGVSYLHSRLQLSCDNRVEFGKDLHTQSPGADFPEMGDPFGLPLTLYWIWEDHGGLN